MCLLSRDERRLPAVAMVIASKQAFNVGILMAAIFASRILLLHFGYSRIRGWPRLGRDGHVARAIHAYNGILGYAGFTPRASRGWVRLDFRNEDDDQECDWAEQDRQHEPPAPWPILGRCD